MSRVVAACGDLVLSGLMGARAGGAGQCEHQLRRPFGLDYEAPADTRRPGCCVAQGMGRQWLIKDEIPATK